MLRLRAFWLQIKVHAQRKEQLAGFGVQLAPIDPAMRVVGLPADKNILGDVQVGEQAQFLVDGGDPGLATIHAVSAK